MRGDLLKGLVLAVGFLVDVLLEKAEDHVQKEARLNQVVGDLQNFLIRVPKSGILGVHDDVVAGCHSHEDVKGPLPLRLLFDDQPVHEPLVGLSQGLDLLGKLAIREVFRR